MVKYAIETNGLVFRVLVKDRYGSLSPANKNLDAVEDVMHALRKHKVGVGSVYKTAGHIEAEFQTEAAAVEFVRAKLGETGERVRKWCVV